jgi:putative tryptophan/tyrosine transport system substrate-binding protein
MRRIGLVVVLALSLASLLLIGAQAEKVWRVGILVVANPRLYDGFVDELRKFGYVNGQNLALEFRNAEGKYERLPTLAAELVHAGVDVILAAGGESSLLAARQATTTIPVVIVAIDYDPLALRHVASLARPGGNVTGVFLQQIELTTKRMELLKATLPNLTRVAILGDASAADQFKAAEAAARSLGFHVQLLESRNPPDDFRGVFATAVKDHAGAVFVVTTGVLFRERAQIAQLALNNRLPAIFAFREYADAGGLMSYGANLGELFRRAARYVDKILKGAKPADLPVEQPTKFELVINMKTAKALGITIPQPIMLRADQIIE